MGSHTSDVAQIKGSEPSLRVTEAWNSKGFTLTGAHFIICREKTKGTGKEQQNSENQIGMIP